MKNSSVEKRHARPGSAARWLLMVAALVASSVFVLEATCCADPEYYCDACEGLSGEPNPPPHVACTADTDCMMLAPQTYESGCDCISDTDSKDYYGCATYDMPHCVMGACAWRETLAMDRCSSSGT